MIPSLGEATQGSPHATPGAVAYSAPMALPRVPHAAAHVSTALGTVLLAVLLAVLLVACGGEDASPAVPAPTTATIGELDPDALDVVRVEFCDLVPKAAIRRALGGGAVEADAWKNGDPVPGGKPGDVGHEVGCAWKGKKGRTAKAWVFARPVSTPFARSLVTSAAARRGCRVVKGATFGKPTVAQLCSSTSPGAKGGVTRMRYAGLFADTWLTCETTGPRDRRAEVKARAGSWCVAVATALDAAG